MHKPVLLKEAIAGLNLNEESVVVDATLGGGGHSSEILKMIGSKGGLIAIDRDAKAVENFREKNDNINLILINDNFSNIKKILKENGIEEVDAILADFGLSSDQLDNSERGFSFLSDADLDMRMDRSQKLTAVDVVNYYSEEELKKILWEYGEEKYAPMIARKIVENRIKKPIEKVSELVSLIESSVPEEYKKGKIHFATKTFQALRIEVNDELNSINKFLKGAISILKPGGRLVTIAFHSGEDRITKNTFKNFEKGCICPPEFPVCRCGKKSLISIITKKPIVASEEEIRENPRARSAKMRIVEKK
ncbi:MAG: 16S rRNA (cytosine(1402)-N(4))-methyltransferase RsmH [Candidatus Moranbacteria bacterium]|nr:16S rRNA (cytosine(1402)-N(4))-methyltransferase RsmH [Candidatus Moranbacteria bacterium]